MNSRLAMTDSGLIQTQIKPAVESESGGTSSTLGATVNVLCVVLGTGLVQLPYGLVNAPHTTPHLNDQASRRSTNSILGLTCSRAHASARTIVGERIVWWWW